MYSCRGRFCQLEELTAENDRALFELMSDNAVEYQCMVSDEPISVTYEDFKGKLKAWFEGGRQYQFLVRKHDDKNLVGTIFFYGLNKNTQTVKCSAFFVPHIRRSACVAESLGMAIQFAALIIGVVELHFSVYTDNEIMRKMAVKVGAEQMEEKASVINRDRSVITYRLSSSRIESILRKADAFYRRRRVN